MEGENSIEFYLDKGDAHRSYQQDAARSFQAISVAFDAVPRNIVLNVCEWGWTHPYEGWGADVGHSWRTTTDITTSAGSVWWNNHPQGQSIMQIYEKNVILDEYAGPYGYNDADMLAVGLSGINAEDVYKRQGVRRKASGFRHHRRPWSRAEYDGGPGLRTAPEQAGG